MNTLLQIKDGVCGYNGIPVVSDVTMEFSLGDFIIFEGENGSGKSTVIKTLLNLIQPISGTFQWHIPQSSIGYVPQDIPLDLSSPATALDVIKTAFLFRNKSNRDKAYAALEQVGLPNQAHQRFGTLSGGQRRRVLFARALANDASCYILDEPTVNMDKETEQELGNLLHRLVNQENKAVIATSHVKEWLNHSQQYHIVNGRFHG